MSRYTHFYIDLYILVSTFPQTRYGRQMRNSIYRYCNASHCCPTFRFTRTCNISHCGFPLYLDHTYMVLKAGAHFNMYKYHSNSHCCPPLYGIDVKCVSQYLYISQRFRLLLPPISSSHRYGIEGKCTFQYLKISQRFTLLPTLFKVTQILYGGICTFQNVYRSDSHCCPPLFPDLSDIADSNFNICKYRSKSHCWPPPISNSNRCGIEVKCTFQYLNILWRLTLLPTLF